LTSQAATAFDLLAQGKPNLFNGNLTRFDL
jgi:hypothetical protein